MTAKEAYKYCKWCNDNYILIFPIPVNNVGLYKIAVSTNGEVKQGELLFRNVPLKGELSVWDKIRELYKEIFLKKNKEIENEHTDTAATRT